MPRPRKRGPRACVFGESRRRKAAMERREARTRRHGCPRRKAWIEEGCAAWRSIPSAFEGGRRKETTAPRAPKKRGRLIRVFFYPPPGRGGGGARRGGGVRPRW